MLICSTENVSGDSDFEKAILSSEGEKCSVNIDFGVAEKKDGLKFLMTSARKLSAPTKKKVIIIIMIIDITPWSRRQWTEY